MIGYQNIPAATPEMTRKEQSCPIFPRALQGWRFRLVAARIEARIDKMECGLLRALSATIVLMLNRRAGASLSILALSIQLT